MSNVMNLRRDMNWIADSAELTTAVAATWPALGAIQDDGTLYITHGHFRTPRLSLAGAAGDFVYYGVQMRWQPDLGAIPYRLKGSAPSANAMWFVQWLGINVRYVHIGKNIDDVWCLRQPAAHTGTENLRFGVAIPADAGNGFAQLSVQNLINQPDQYNGAVY